MSISHPDVVLHASVESGVLRGNLGPETPRFFLKTKAHEISLLIFLDSVLSDVIECPCTMR